MRINFLFKDFITKLLVKSPDKRLVEEMSILTIIKLRARLQSGYSQSWR